MSDKNKKQNPMASSKAEGIIKSLVNLVGVTAGIIIVSIGAVMFLESIFKIYIFDLKQDRYSRFDYRCEQYDIDSIKARKLIGDRDFLMEGALNVAPIKQAKDKKNKKLTKEEEKFLERKYKECKLEAKTEAEKDFQRKEKMDIAEGIAFMLVGFPLLYFYQRRRRSKK
jgi:hypothetical protein